MKITKKLTLAALFGLGIASAAQGAVIINEVDADQVGTDAAEFVELFNTDLLNPVDLTANGGTVLVLYNGGLANDGSYFALNLTGTIPAGGYYVIGNTGVVTANQTFANDFLQNGADAVAIYQAQAAAFPNGTAPTATGILDAVVYDTADADETNLIAILTPGQPQIDENPNGLGISQSIGRFPNGSGAALDTSAYTILLPTPGAANAVPEPAAFGLVAGAFIAMLRRRRTA